jgi:hypothetical protein
VLEDGTGVGEVEERWTEPALTSRAHRFEEAPPLLLREDRIELLALREVRADPVDADPSETGESVEEVLPVRQRHAEPAHAGVDLDVDPVRLLALAGRAIDPLCFLEIAHDGSEPMADRLFGAGRARSPEAEDRVLDPRRAQLLPFFDERDAEPVTTGGLECLRTSDRAMSVRIPLHRREHAGVRRE